MPRLRDAVHVGVALIRETLSAYGRLAGSQFAAAISYRALFSLVPLATFVTTILGEVLAERTASRTDLVDTVSDRLHLTGQGAQSLDNAIGAVPSPWSVVGLVSLGLALWGATGVMSSVQKALAVIFDGGEGRHFVRGRLVSSLLVLGVMALLIAAAVVSLLATAVAGLSADLGDAVGLPLPDLGLLFGVVVPLALTVAVCVLLIRLLPHAKPSWRAALLGGGAAAVGIQVIQWGLSWYLTGPADFTELYGPAGAVFAFLFSVYLGASAFVIGSVLVAVIDEHLQAGWPAA